MMANLSKDFQCAGSDTRLSMLDRTDFESWQQRIRLYCLGKDNGVNILKSINEGPFKMGKFRETLAEGALHLGLERDRVFVDLTQEEKQRFKAEIRAMNILLQGEQLQLEMGEFRTELAMQMQENGVVLDKEQLLFIAGGKTNTFGDDVD
nr:integrase, catalytic region, zinc finger, CCHC-type, peptidase aspartic, catalytic [Tanacetum cinerariifolium]